AVGATQTLTITVGVVSPNPQANTASISHADQFDPDTANNSDTASVNPQQADLALGKTVSDPRPNVGDTVTFTVALTNNGFADAPGVQVRAALPAGLRLVRAPPRQGSYPAALSTVCSAANGAPETLTLHAGVDSPTPQTNTASISHSDQFDPDL